MTDVSSVTEITQMQCAFVIYLQQNLVELLYFQSLRTLTRRSTLKSESLTGKSGIVAGESAFLVPYSQGPADTLLLYYL